MTKKTDKCTPLLGRVGRLDTIHDAKHLAGRVIKAGLVGKISQADARSVVWQLREFANLARDHDLEKRIEALEKLNV